MVPPLHADHRARSVTNVERLHSPRDFVVVAPKSNGIFPKLLWQYLFLSFLYTTQVFHSSLIKSLNVFFHAVFCGIEFPFLNQLLPLHLTRKTLQV